MTINRIWHESHRMPKNPSDAERLRWHIGHAKHCACRAAPDWVKEQMKKREERKHQARSA